MKLLGCTLVAAGLAVMGGAQPASDLQVDAERLESRILALGEHGKNPQGGVSRVAYSDFDLAGRRYLTGLMREAGLDVRIDAAGNIFGRREGADSALPPILFGSHSDSVPAGGNYDGPAGTLSAIEVAQVLHENSVRTRHALEVVIFQNEEGGLIGSKSMVGILDAAALDEVSHSGLTMRDGINRIGGDVAQLARAKRKAGDFAAYVELHIEQGAVLYDEGLQIGVVQGIVGISWWDMIVEGSANHAGTTPMNKRSDALLGASELVLAVNRVIRSEPGAQVGTVGRIQAFPGVPNVVPGRVEASLEIRDLSHERVLALETRIEGEARRIAEATGTRISFRKSPIEEHPAETDPRIREAAAASAEELGYSFKRMPSGAGHDAQAVARIAPIGMIFVPSVDGLSHSPKEFTKPEDLARGANVLLHTILKLDQMELDGRDKP
jgi:N-carbamoyl-L-amino-acid hydrolase